MSTDLTTGLRVNTVGDLMTLGKIAASSGLVPKDYQNQPEKCAGAIAFAPAPRVLHTGRQPWPPSTTCSRPWRRWS